jgi:HPt (histidine-containing phosphotransfer) domain-containing protein
MSAPATAAPVDTPLLDAALLRQFAADDLLPDIVRMFLAECPRRVLQVRRALDVGDTEALRIVAHALRSSVVMLGAGRAAGAATRLENSVRRGDLLLAREALALLERELAAVLPVLERLLHQPGFRAAML